MAEEKEEHKIVSHKEVTMVIPVIKTPGWLQGFVNFVREQGVVGISVGLIIGLGAKSLVDSFVASFVNPIVGFVLGGTNLSARYFCLATDATGACTSKITWGLFLNQLISFIIILAIVYFVVKGLKLDKLDKKKG